MTRLELEAKARETYQKAKSQINSEPIPAFCIALFLGFAIGIFREVVIPIVVLIILFLAILWVLPQKELPK